MKTCKICQKEYSEKRSESTCSYDCQKKYDALSRKKYQEKTEAIARVINPLPQSNYTVDCELRDIEDMFDRYARSYDGFEYCPDFQRGHVWTLQQQIAYMEAFIRGTLGANQKTIILNCPDFQDSPPDDSDLKGFCIVDGLQRVTAMIDFYKGKFKVFNDTYTFDCFNGSRYSLRTHNLKIQVFSFAYKVDLLKYYVAINSGGVVHSDSEINRVKQMIAEIENVI